MLALLCGTAGGFAAAGAGSARVALEAELLDLIAGGATDSVIATSVAALEATGGVSGEPARSPLIEGTWQLLHTSKSSFDARNPLGRRVDGSAPGLEGVIAGVTGGEAASASSSPIQRAVTGAFRVTQSLRRVTEPGAGRVEQLVATPLGDLHLNAAASADADGRRINFAFDEGFFLASSGLRLPYPVPFRLLGKEAEGYLDTSYLGERVRVSTGNKGTTFVLRRVESAG